MLSSPQARGGGSVDLGFQKNATSYQFTIDDQLVFGLHLLNFRNQDCKSRWAYNGKQSPQSEGGKLAKGRIGSMLLGALVWRILLASTVAISRKTTHRIGEGWPATPPQPLNPINRSCPIVTTKWLYSHWAASKNHPTIDQPLS
ncbi:hypothetical protein E3N88_06778 [Mikania micrantha]|uniref:Uncharacterized protein n=1 Tax=Mikania micrantha TaxID=192012 RepID=A0A5N6PQQ9_9ASTR|nr:hypothetical protein E3N88_06778 [Mikania micrantha]